VSLSGATARQIKNVLRLRPGDRITVLDNSGLEWTVRLTDVRPDRVRGEIESRQAASGEPALEMTLYQGLLKGDKFEWLLQKGTELGISRFVPVICRRSVVTSVSAQKEARWRQIIREAAEQSRRGKLPTLAEPLPLAEALAGADAPLRLMAWEEAAGGPGLKEILAGAAGTSIAIFIGPEGGLTPEEAALGQAAGARLVRLGPRILRAETAGLALTAAIFYALGEWG
jgi:16S rRNA (uracil1498-N3)-methyltransferase